MGNKQLSCSFNNSNRIAEIRNTHLHQKKPKSFSWSCHKEVSHLENCKDIHNKTWPLNNLIIEGAEQGLDTLFTQTDAMATIYFVNKFCVATIQEWQLFESNVYFAHPNNLFFFFNKILVDIVYHCC